MDLVQSSEREEANPRGVPVEKLNVGNGESIRFRDDGWVPELLGAKVTPSPNRQEEFQRVVEFIDQPSDTWTGFGET